MIALSARHCQHLLLGPNPLLQRSHLPAFDCCRTDRKTACHCRQSADFLGDFLKYFYRTGRKRNNVRFLSPALSSLGLDCPNTFLEVNFVPSCAYRFLRSARRQDSEFDREPGHALDAGQSFHKSGNFAPIQCRMMPGRTDIAWLWQ